MYSKLPLFVKRLNEVARLPVKGSERAAGYDLFSAEDSVVPARGKALIKTGISIAVPPGNYGRVGI
jgi:dUTPase